jgi:hypothetical protein
MTVTRRLAAARASKQTRITDLKLFLIALDDFLAQLDFVEGFDESMHTISQLLDESHKDLGNVMDDLQLNLRGEGEMQARMDLAQRAINVINTVWETTQNEAVKDTGIDYAPLRRTAELAIEGLRTFLVAPEKNQIMR